MKRRRKRPLTARQRRIWRPETPYSRKLPTRSIGARVTIPVFELIEDAAAFAGCPRSKIVEDGATARAREIVAHHITLVERAKRRARAARRTARLT